MIVFEFVTNSLLYVVCSSIPDCKAYCSIFLFYIWNFNIFIYFIFEISQISIKLGKMVL